MALLPKLGVHYDTFTIARGHNGTLTIARGTQ